MTIAGQEYKFRDDLMLKEQREALSLLSELEMVARKYIAGEDVDLTEAQTKWQRACQLVFTETTGLPPIDGLKGGSGAIRALGADFFLATSRINA